MRENERDKSFCINDSNRCYFFVGGVAIMLDRRESIFRVIGRLIGVRNEK